MNHRCNDCRKKIRLNKGVSWKLVMPNEGAFFTTHILPLAKVYRCKRCSKKLGPLVSDKYEYGMIERRSK